MDQLGRAHPRRHSHFRRTAPARTHPVAANRQRRHPQRRGRVHFCRGADHAHRAVAAVPARHGTHHEKRGRAHRAGGARRRDGQHFQLQTSPLRLEMAAQNPASGHGQLRRAAAADRHAVRDAAGRPGTARVRLAASPRPDETAAPPVRADGAEIPAAVCDGRRAEQKSHLRRGAGENRFSRAPAEKNLGWPGNGRDFPAAVRAGRAGELRRAALRQGAGESELHPVRSDARLVREAMRAQNRHHVAAVFGEGETGAAVRDDLSRRRGWSGAPPRLGRRKI